jgi:hypothetical protein
VLRQWGRLVVKFQHAKKINTRRRSHPTIAQHRKKSMIRLSKDLAEVTATSQQSEDASKKNKGQSETIVFSFFYPLRTENKNLNY